VALTVRTRLVRLLVRALAARVAAGFFDARASTVKAPVAGVPAAWSMLAAAEAGSVATTQQNTTQPLPVRSKRRQSGMRRTWGKTMRKDGSAGEKWRGVP
jgi:hypothetical protein